MTTRNKKKKLISSRPVNTRSRNNSNMDVGEDRISELPESLILHILSFLPTKHAVSTTVLSKRWNNLWISLPVLDFLSPWIETNRMMDLLDKILFSNNTTKIQKFCANFASVHFDENRVREWIAALITRKVEALVLSVRFSVPVELFTCESLTMLNLQGQKSRLDFPQSISLPRLNVLRLSCVEFKDMASTQQLFSNCPVLEKLSLWGCSGKDVISFSAPNLKCFTLELSENLKVEIDAPNLASIDFRGLTNIPVGSFPSLVKAKLFYAYADKTITQDSLYNFIRMYSNIKLLEASSECIQILAKVSSTSFPTFNNLVRLEVVYVDYSCSRPPISSLINFLHFSPNLESLIMNLKCYTPELNWNELTLNTPHCLLERLKSVTIKIFNGFPSKEMELVKWFLKHAKVLDQLVLIIISRCTYSTTKTIEELQSFPRASTHCKFQVS